MTNYKPIGVDIHGGDIVSGMSATFRVVNALQEVAQNHPEREFVSIGNKIEFERDFSRDSLPENVRMEYDCNDDEGAVKTLAKMVSGGKICGFYTCEKTRIVTPRITHDIGLIDECRRNFNFKSCRIPPLTAELPKQVEVKHARTWYFLDTGANASMDDAEQALFYARAGNGFARISGRSYPKVGLLNIGEEGSVGGKLMRSCYDSLSKDKRISFVGNIEPWTCFYDFEDGRKDYFREVDMVVTDARAGNLFIKLVKAAIHLFVDQIKHNIKKQNLARQLIARETTKKDLEEAARDLDPNKYAGGLFLGLNALVVKGNGITQISGIKTGLEKLIKYDEMDVVNKMRGVFC